jgi:hypothetical protein
VHTTYFTSMNSVGITIILCIILYLGPGVA